MAYFHGYAEQGRTHYSTFEEVKQQLSDQTITSNVETFTQLSKEYKELSQIHGICSLSTRPFQYRG